MNKLISVIIPMHNVGVYIGRCLQSLRCGRYSNIEIICIDDGSVDDTVSVVSDCAKTDQRIKLITQSNKGVSNARNRGLLEAVGSYVAFIDADDWVSNDYLWVLYETAEEKRADIVSCDFYPCSRYYLSSDLETEYEIIEYSDNDKMKNLMRSVWGVLYRKDICQTFDENLSIGEDQLFNIRILSQNKDLRVWKCSKQMYYHFYHRNSLMGCAGIDWHYNLCKAIFMVLDTLLIKRYAVSNATRHALAYRYYSAAAGARAEEKSNHLIKHIRKLLLSCPDMSFREKAVYFVALCSPHLYKWRKKLKQQK